MRIDGFIWLPDIVEKLAVKHHVTEDEVEEVFFRRPLFRCVEHGHCEGEDVYSAREDRRWKVHDRVLIYKPDHLALIVSAQDMDAKERRRYERR